MTTKHVDLAVIGAGTAGLTAAYKAATYDANVMLIDPNVSIHDMGINMFPMRMLTELAANVHHAQMASTLGLEIKGKPSLSKAMKYLYNLHTTITKPIPPDRFRRMGIQRLHGRAEFQQSNQLRIVEGSDVGTLVHAKRTIIAAGSRQRALPINGLAECEPWSMETLLNLQQDPESMIIIGANHFALEMAQALARFGIKVIVLETAQRLLPLEEPELVRILKRRLEQEGVQFLINAKILSISRTLENEYDVMIQENGGAKTLHSVGLLVNGDDHANADQLGLEHTRAQIVNGKLAVNTYLQTNDQRIYGAGDVIGRYPYGHCAAAEAEIALSNALLGARKKMHDHQIPWVINTEPELYHFGSTEAQLRQHRQDLRVYDLPLSEIKRFQFERAVEGRIKIITDHHGQILGGHALAPGAGEFMQELGYAAYLGQPIESISKVIHPYLARSSALRRAADIAAHEKTFSSLGNKLVKKWVNWRFKRL